MKHALKSTLLVLFASTSAWSAEVPTAATTEPMVRAEFKPKENKFSLRIDPLMLLLGEVNADFQIRLTDHLSLGPTVGYMGSGDGVYYGSLVSRRVFFNDKTDRRSIGAKAVYYFNGFSRHSPYAGVSAKSSRSIVTGESRSTLFDPGLTSKGEFSETLGAAIGGYQWVWQSFVLNAGAGFGYYSHAEKFALNYSDGAFSTYSISGPPLSFLMDVGMGFTF